MASDTNEQTRRSIQVSPGSPPYLEKCQNLCSHRTALPNVIQIHHQPPAGLFHRLYHLQEPAFTTKRHKYFDIIYFEKQTYTLKFFVGIRFDKILMGALRMKIRLFEYLLTVKKLYAGTIATVRIFKI